mgnify:CR=1 FL=1
MASGQVKNGLIKDPLTGTSFDLKTGAVAGKWRTGKSFLLRHLIQSLEKKHPGGVAVTAPTGIAASHVQHLVMRNSLEALGLSRFVTTPNHDPLDVLATGFTGKDDKHPKRATTGFVLCAPTAHSQSLGLPRGDGAPSPTYASAEAGEIAIASTKAARLS